MSLAQVFSRIFLWLAIISALAGVGFLSGNLHYYFSSETTEAQISDYRVEHNPIPFSDESSGNVYYPIISIITVNNELISFESSTPHNALDFLVGDQVIVRYIPGDIESFKMDSIMDLWGQAIVLLGLALFFLIASLVSKKGFDKKKY